MGSEFKIARQCYVMLHSEICYKWLNHVKKSEI